MLGQEEAIRLKHEYFGAVHIFLGLLRTSRGAASAALDSMGVDREAVKSQAESMYPSGTASSERKELPYDKAGITLLQTAMAEARSSSAGCVSTGHLLLAGLTTIDDSPYRILADVGVNVGDLASALRAQLSDDG